MPNTAQDSFDKFVINGMKIIHTPDVTRSIIERIAASPNRIDAIGESVLDIVTRLERSGNESKFPITANTILNGINVFIGEVINIAEAAGVEKLSEEERYQAFAWTISNYIDRAVKEGRISKEELIQMGQQMMQQKQNGNEPQGAPGKMAEGQPTSPPPGILSQGGV